MALLCMFKYGIVCATCAGQSKPTPQLEVKSVAYDRTLGGNAWDLRLRDHLLGEFMKNKKVKGIGPIAHTAGCPKWFSQAL